MTAFGDRDEGRSAPSAPPPGAGSDAFGARAEAFARLEGRFDVRVLEPSPPAAAGPAFADDPVAGGEVVPVERVGSRSWASLCDAGEAVEGGEGGEGGDGGGGRGGADAALAAWCGERWLAGWHRLSELPVLYAETRAGLHAVAEHVMAPARYRANGKIGLRFTRGGFGTPFFAATGAGVSAGGAGAVDESSVGGGAGGSGVAGRAGAVVDRQVRIEDGQLVVCSGNVTRWTAVTTLRDAARFVGIGAPGAPVGVYTPNTPGDAEVTLTVDRAAAHALGEWYGFCASVLEQLRSESGDASLVQLWPEHFDLAVDLGDQGTDGRANFGGSPGDDGHREPYLYIGPWVPRVAGAPGVGDFWNEPFGASLSYQSLLAADTAAEQRALALAFLRRGRDLLADAG